MARHPLRAQRAKGADPQAPGGVSALNVPRGPARRDGGDARLPSSRADTPTGERFRIVVDTCDECAHTESPQSEVSDTVAAEAACDAEVVDMRPGPTQGHVTRTIAPVLRVKLLHAARWKCEVRGCCNRLWLDVHHLRHRADGGGNEVENLVILCSAHHRAVHLGGLALDRDPRGAVVVTHRAGRPHVVGDDTKT